jgi:hypothetical protein
MATAETPKRSWKRTVASTVEGRTPRFLLGSLVLAMVISLVAGLAIGVKIGEHSKNSSKAAVVRPTPTTKKRVKVVSAFAKPPLKGVVVRSLPKLLVLSSGKARIRLGYLPRSHIEATALATRSDIKAGSRVVFVLSPKAPTTTPTTAAGTPTSAGTVAPPALAAKEILIVSGATAGRMGSLVTKVTSNSMVFKGANRRLISISTVGAVVRKTVPATKAKLTAGRHVLVRAFFVVAKKKAGAKKNARAKRTRVAFEVVVLPGDTALG